MNNFLKKSLSSIFMLALLALACSAKRTVVGGPCTYTEFAGKCSFTVDQKGAYFTFFGNVNGSQVELKGNEAAGGYNNKDVLDCSLKFITDGTCTPCGYDIQGKWGSCGEEAWELFRASSGG